MIDIQWEQQTVAVGDALSGELTWHPTHNKMPKNATISIGWYTEGRGTRDRQIVHELPLDPSQLSSSQELPLPFLLTVPRDGPITYNGTLIRVIWELKVLIDMPGWLTKDDKQTWPFQVISR